MFFNFGIENEWIDRRKYVSFSFAFIHFTYDKDIQEFEFNLIVLGLGFTILIYSNDAPKKILNKSRHAKNL